MGYNIQKMSTNNFEHETPRQSSVDLHHLLFPFMLYLCTTNPLDRTQDMINALLLSFLIRCNQDGITKREGMLIVGDAWERYAEVFLELASTGNRTRDLSH